MAITIVNFEFYSFLYTFLYFTWGVRVSYLITQQSQQILYCLLMYVCGRRQIVYEI